MPPDGGSGEKKVVNYADTLARVTFGGGRFSTQPPPLDKPRIRPEVVDARINEGKKEKSELLKLEMRKLYNRAKAVLTEPVLKSKIKGQLEMLETAHKRGTLEEDEKVKNLVPLADGYKDFVLYRLLEELVADKPASAEGSTTAQEYGDKFDLPRPYSIYDFLSKLALETEKVSTEKKAQESFYQGRSQEMKRVSKRAEEIYVCPNNHAFTEAAVMDGGKCPECKTQLGVDSTIKSRQQKGLFLGTTPDGGAALVTVRSPKSFEIRAWTSKTEKSLVTVIP
ncbi:hypothetical protein K8Q93_02360 [Candidatus Parcubacteria bacterium]|nr:hypothetical protein [Candidatus Parcubacteria bacterium]